MTAIEGGVALVDLGQRPGQAERAERVLQHGARGLGGVSLASRQRGQAVEDLETQVI
jgi:hypothetical protein